MEFCKKASLKYPGLCTIPNPESDSRHSCGTSVPVKSVFLGLSMMALPSEVFYEFLCSVIPCRSLLKM